MIHARTPLIRSACLITAAAASMVALSVGLAQERSGDLTLAAAVGQPAPPPELNPRHPDKYVVQRGDTLWDIAAKFLRDPWNWPEIWQINPQVENPHLIFPGDTLSLVYNDNGRPAVTVTERPSAPFSGSGGTEKLSPRVREQPLEQAIQAIPYAQVVAFLSRSTLLEKKDLSQMPYIVANREGLVGSAGRDFYARNMKEARGYVYNVVHLGSKLVDPDDGAMLGYEGLFVGESRVERPGDPATLHLLNSSREALIGDYLGEQNGVVPSDYIPHPPKQEIVGQIISVLDGVALIGQYQVVVINRGAKHGIDPGTALRVYQTGKVVRDAGGGRGGGQGGAQGIEKSSFGRKVRLPDEPAGTMMVFRTFDRMSYALIMEATTPISVFDTVRNP